MQIAKILCHFSGMLEARFAAGVFTTEDSIRYTFYTAACLYGDVKHTEVVLEFPHPAIADAKIDTIISSTAERASTAIEFKYDRENPGGSNQNRTQRAASVLVDIFRLARIPAGVADQRYLVYVTDREMALYFKNPANGLHDFFELAGPDAISFGPTTFLGFSRTFRTRISPHLCECNVRARFSTELGNNIVMRAFEVFPPQ